MSNDSFITNKKFRSCYDIKILYRLLEKHILFSLLNQLYWIENGLLEKRLTWLLNYILSHVLEISYFQSINASKMVLLDIGEGCVREGHCMI